MRALLLFSFITCFTFNSFSGDLNIRIEDNSFMLFQLDNSFFNKPQRTYSLSNVVDGYHYVQVYRVSEENGDTELIFKGYIFIPDRSVVDAVVLNDHRIKVSTGYMMRPADNTSTPVPQGQSTNPSGSNAPKGENNTSKNTAPQKASNPITTGTTKPVAMTDKDLVTIKKALEKDTVSTSKLSKAKEMLDGKYVNSAQVASLVKLFLFESDKLELAKFCYDITVDRSKFYLVNDSFSFPSSVKEMNEYIDSINKK